MQGRLQQGAGEPLSAGEWEAVEQMLRESAEAAPPSLAQAARLALAPGKRVRARVAMLACVACGGAPAHAADAAAAVELLHAASLVLDDILDESPRRRHGPSVVAAHGTRTAMLTSGWLVARAAHLAAPTSPEDASERLPDLHACLSTFQDMIAAEAKAAAPGEAPLDEDGWTDLALGKTAGLFAVAAEAGARRAGRPDLAPALRAFGLHLGLAFQAADDVLDATGDADAAGKPVQADFARGAPNLVAAAGVDGARAFAERHAALAAEALEPVPPGAGRDELARVAAAAARRDR